METSLRPFGFSLLVDLYDCDPRTIDDINLVYKFLIDAVNVLGVTTQAPPYVFHSPSEFPDKAGISAWVPLIESGIQCHTLTAKNFVSVDYYTCSMVDEGLAQKLITLAKAYFVTEKVETQLLKRGLTYYE